MRSKSYLTQHVAHEFLYSFGYPVRLFERYRLIKVLLEALPDREKRIKTNKRLQAIRERADGVTVEFTDGTVEEGSIVIGADGVHSGVRRLLSEQHPGAIDANPYISIYCGLYGHGPIHPAVAQGETAEFHHDGWSFQLLTALDRTFYFVYCKLDTPTKNRKRFTETDVLEFSKPYLDKGLFADITFKDLWDTKDLGNLRLLEQGISKTWSHGRLVLVGDAVHKVIFSSPTHPRLTIH
jgi:2-polyprenyl-6-methoxyphenol hydroxylase-like FAD-dependent oxidoreductase